ncbi:gamma carbonic anhydrase family protein [Anaerosinus massiliensis]|uniref:gamma carbonic anhydrase family protein n=1 Tax=Massilibacillus massiliensis TaxID=1806837 RepID=UPI000AC08F8E|nr:gamma carbonic anhydrase family protein [Massilibacillus massiliensis]
MDEKSIVPYKSLKPSIDSSVYVADGVVIIGDVKIEHGSSIWFNSVLRGDIDRIHIGKYTNIQDNSTVHVMGDHPAIIGDYVTVGHNAVVHGCTVGNNCLIGMGAILLGYCKIGDNCIVAAGTLVTERKEIPPNSMVMGAPGKVVRTLTDEEVRAIKESAINYNLVAQEYILR